MLLVSSSPYDTQYYCAAILDAGGLNAFVSFLLLVLIREACITSAQHSGMQENVIVSFSFLLLVSIREARIATAQPFGMQENANVFFFLFGFGFNPRGTYYYCAALRDAGERKIFVFPFCFLFRSERHALLLRSIPGCRRMQKIFVSFLLFVSIQEARTTTAQHSGMQENAKDFCFLFAFCFDPRGTYYYCGAPRDACKVHGVSVCVHAVINLQGPAHKIDRVKKVRIRIMQGSWD